SLNTALWYHFLTTILWAKDCEIVTSRSILTNSGPILTQLRFRLQQSRINLDRTPVLVRTFALPQFVTSRSNFIQTPDSGSFDRSSGSFDPTPDPSH
ncbi:hypothetical protein FB45DRAFT_898549, partial [Roridomyces roridus]